MFDISKIIKKKIQLWSLPASFGRKGWTEDRPGSSVGISGESWKPPTGQQESWKPPTELPTPLVLLVIWKPHGSFSHLHGRHGYVSYKFLGAVNMKMFFWTKMSLRFLNFEPFDVGPTLIGREFRTLGRMFFFFRKQIRRKLHPAEKKTTSAENKHQSRRKNTSAFFLFFFCDRVFAFLLAGIDRHVECQDHVCWGNVFSNKLERVAFWIAGEFFFKWKIGKNAVRDTPSSGSFLFWRHLSIRSMFQLLR